MPPVENPRISVCIPTCGRPGFLREAILSAAGQQPPPFEVLVGDDSEDDRSQEAVDSIRAPGVRIRCWRNTPALGQAANVRHLFHEAAGELVTLLHDDDRFRPGAFAALLAPLREHPEVLASFGRQVLLSEDGTEDWKASATLNRDYGRLPERAGRITNALEAGAAGMFPNDGFLMRTPEARATDYDADGRAGNASDYFFGLRLGLLGRPFYLVNADASEYRLTASSVARNGTNSAFFAMKLLFETVPEERFTPAIRRMIRRKMNAAIHSGVSVNRAQCWAWYFSKWHRRSIPTRGGLNRLRRLLKP